MTELDTRDIVELGILTTFLAIGTLSIVTLGISVTTIMTMNELKREIEFSQHKLHIINENLKKYSHSYFPYNNINDGTWTGNL
jgi:hypothetical protein